MSNNNHVRPRRGRKAADNNDRAKMITDTHTSTPLLFFFFYPCVMYYQSIKGHSCAAVPQQAAAVASLRRVYTLRKRDLNGNRFPADAATLPGRRDLDREKLEPPLWPPVCFMRVCLRLAAAAVCSRTGRHARLTVWHLVAPHDAGWGQSFSRLRSRKRGIDDAASTSTINARTQIINGTKAKAKEKSERVKIQSVNDRKMDIKHKSVWC